MALRSHVSRIAARGVTQPADTAGQPNALDNLRPEIPEDESPELEAAEGPETAHETPARTVGARGGVREAATVAPKRQGRPLDSRNKPATETPPALTLMSTESVPELRAKIKDVEQAIKDARLRHDTEMKTLKTVYADLHARMFDHVK